MACANKRQSMHQSARAGGKAGVLEPSAAGFGRIYPCCPRGTRGSLVVVWWTGDDDDDHHHEQVRARDSGEAFNVDENQVSVFDSCPSPSFARAWELTDSRHFCELSVRCVCVHLPMILRRQPRPGTEVRGQLKNVAAPATTLSALRPALGIGRLAFGKCMSSCWDSMTKPRNLCDHISLAPAAFPTCAAVLASLRKIRRVQFLVWIGLFSSLDPPIRAAVLYENVGARCDYARDRVLRMHTRGLYTIRPGLTNKRTTLGRRRLELEGWSSDEE